MAALLALDRLSRRYGAVRAVDGVSLAFEAGRIHAVVGENGAGKSTLLKMAAGVVVPDAGEVRIDGVRLAPAHGARGDRARRRDGAAALRARGRPAGDRERDARRRAGGPARAARPRRGRGRARRPWRASSGSRCRGTRRWRRSASAIGSGSRSCARSSARRASSSSTSRPRCSRRARRAQLYATLRRLADAGRAIVVVTHRLDEVRDHADDVTRHAARDARLDAAVGRGRRRRGPRRRRARRDHARHHGRGAAAAHRAARRASRARCGIAMKDVVLGRALRGVTLEVRAGEIVGVAGVEGNGQRELVRVLAGLEAPDGGTVRCAPAAVVHEDRHAEGLVLDGERARQPRARRARALHAPAGCVDGEALEREARTRLERGEVVPADLDATAASLSGGNQQKIVVARAVARARVDVFVLAQPTRGVDLGAARAIHAEIVRAAGDGAGGARRQRRSRRAARALRSHRASWRAAASWRELPPDASDAAIGEAMLGGRATRRRARPGRERADARRDRRDRRGGGRGLARVRAARVDLRRGAARGRRGAASAERGGCRTASGRCSSRRRRSSSPGSRSTSRCAPGSSTSAPRGSSRSRASRSGPSGRRLPQGTPAVVALPLAVAAALAAGAAWAAVPALLRARFGAHEVISTIMMNRIADAAVGARARERPRRDRAPCARPTSCRAPACRASTRWGSRRSTAAP